MKRKEGKKLTFNKSMIARLNQMEMNVAHAGLVRAIWLRIPRETDNCETVNNCTYSCNVACDYPTQVNCN